MSTHDNPTAALPIEVPAELSEALYKELRRLAAYYLQRERPDHTLQPTALVHEAWIRMQGDRKPPWKDRTHFFSFAARVMRHVLVDHARQHRAGKRPTAGARCGLDEVRLFSLDYSEELLIVDNALNRLAALDARQCQIVELKFFAGLTDEEIAEVLDVSVRTVKRDWKMAKSWLQSQLP